VEYATEVACPSLPDPDPSVVLAVAELGAAEFGAVKVLLLKRTLLELVDSRTVSV
jgi:hypothetical protein